MASKPPKLQYNVIDQMSKMAFLVPPVCWDDYVLGQSWPVDEETGLPQVTRPSWWSQEYEQQYGNGSWDEKNVPPLLAMTPREDDTKFVKMDEETLRVAVQEVEPERSNTSLGDQDWKGRQESMARGVCGWEFLDLNCEVEGGRASREDGWVFTQLDEQGKGWTKGKWIQGHKGWLRLN
ncbi:MAG: hypothetical protein Q9190_005715 [Brigantiaea leucoxantha]